MFKIGFKEHYKVLHINNELGSHLIGGAGTYMNEMYRYHKSDTGFVYINMGSPLMDFEVENEQKKDILIVHKDEIDKLSKLSFDIMVIQFYEFAFCVTEELRKNKKIVYVIHSVPTTEPVLQHCPFGNSNDVKAKFEYLCEYSDILVCVSNAEKDKLSKLYPQYTDKIKVVHNGITYNEPIRLNENYKKSRKILGYIGRTDYRKGILECIDAIKDMDVELRIACPKNDSAYLEKILLYIKAANMQEKVKFYGWCTGERKEIFLNSLDALVIPSLYEPFGYVALEAMQYGLPVISSNNGGLDEIFEAYKYKYDPYSDNGLKNTIKEFQNDNNDIIDEQQKILVENLSRFHAKDMVAKYEKIWEEL